MTLTDWLTNGWLIEHQTSRQEMGDLLAIADRDLLDCQSSGLSDDWRFNIAYNAALQVSRAALAATGYRAARESHHYRLVQSLALTLCLSADVVRRLDRFRKKRNIAEYDRAGAVSAIEVSEMIDTAKALREKLVEWLNERRPELLEKT